MGQKFIEDFIFLVKKNFLAKFEKLASERNFDVEQFFFIFCHKQIKSNPPGLVYVVRDKLILQMAITVNLQWYCTVFDKKKYFFSH